MPKKKEKTSKKEVTYSKTAMHDKELQDKRIIRKEKDKRMAKK